MVKMQTKTALSLGGMALTLLIYMGGLTVTITKELTTVKVGQENFSEKIGVLIDKTMVTEEQLKENEKGLAVLNSKVNMHHY